MIHPNLIQVLDEALADWEFHDVRIRVNQSTAFLRMGRADVILKVKAALEKIAVPMYQTSRLTNEWAQCPPEEADAWFVDVGNGPK